MGYRLCISKVNEVYYGTKLYGYVDDENKLKSYNYLKDNEYIDGDEIWSYSAENPIVMRVCVFKEFRELYAQDLKDFYDEIISNAFLKETEELTKLGDYDFVVLTWG